MFAISRFNTNLFACTVVITICITKVAKSALDKALAESNMDCEASEEESSKVGSQVSLEQPILVKVDSSADFTRG